MVSLHFWNDNHPIFTERKPTAKGKLVGDSVYYWWYRTLHLSEKYSAACKANGKGLSKIYADFGDVFSYRPDQQGFKKWWQQPHEAYGHKDNLGSFLFAEPPLTQNLVALKQSDLAALMNGWDRTQVEIFAVPLNLPKNEITKRIGALLDKNPHRRLSSKNRRASFARYPVLESFSSTTSNKSHTVAIENALDMFAWKQEQPKLASWKILYEHEGGGKEVTAQLERRYTNEAQRRLTRAKALIKGVEQGIFPAGARTNKR